MAAIGSCDGAESPGSGEGIAPLVAPDGAESVGSRVGDADLWAVCVNGALCLKILAGEAHRFVYVKTLNWHE